MGNNVLFAFSGIFMSCMTFWGVGCGTPQSNAIFYIADVSTCVNHNYFKPYVIEYLMTQDKLIPYTALGGSEKDYVYVEPRSSIYLSTAHVDLNMNVYLYEYHASPCPDCDYVVLYSEDTDIFYVADRDDYAFWIEGPDTRDDTQLRSFFDSTGVANVSEYWLKELVGKVYKLDLADTVSFRSVDRQFERRLIEANEYPISTKIAGKTWGRSYLIKHIESRRDRARQMVDTLSAKGYNLYWDLNFKDGNFAVLVYIHPDHPLDFGIEYF